MTGITRPNATNGRVLVTGPGVHKEVDSPDLGLSFAVTCASHAAHGHLEETFYVHQGDAVVGRCEAFSDGTVSVYGPAQLGVKIHA